MRRPLSAAAPVHYPDMRLFVGIPLSGAVTDELKTLVVCLRTGNDGLRWSAPESWHITLQFLGNAAPDQLECLKSRLGEVRGIPLPVKLGELGFFDRSGVFFADVIVSPELSDLQRRVVEATSGCAFVAETRPYHPHITLARESGNKGRREQGNKALRTLKGALNKRNRPRFSPFIAREFLLYESHLSAEGSRYEVRERYPLINR